MAIFNSYVKLPEVIFMELPSGKHTKNYGKSPCLSIFNRYKSNSFDWAIFNSYVKLPEGNHHQLGYKPSNNGIYHISNL